MSEKFNINDRPKHSTMSYVPEGRTLHLIDLENLMCGARAGFDRAIEAVLEYKSAVPVYSDDHAHVAVNPKLLVESALVWPGAKYFAGRGTDGADKALIDSVNNVFWISCRYDRIVIGSGDHIFLSVVLAFRSVGIPVAVVAPNGSLSRDLASAATYVMEIPSHNEDPKQL